jgi:hypothetical protein
MANAHREEADRQLAHIERLRVRAKMERPGWGPTPLQAVQHQTGKAALQPIPLYTQPPLCLGSLALHRVRVYAVREEEGRGVSRHTWWRHRRAPLTHHACMRAGAATGLTFAIETGKYQLGWREKLFFSESSDRQKRRGEMLAALKKIEGRIVDRWLEYHKLHSDTAAYIAEKERLQNKLQSQKRLDDFRKQFNASLATYQRVGLNPEQYLTRWYTNYMKTLWEKEDLRTFYTGERKMIGAPN